MAMKTITVLLAGLVVAIALAVASWMILNRPAQTAPQEVARVATVEPPKNPQPPVATPITSEPSPAEKISTVPESTPSQLAKSEAQQPIAPQTKPPKKPKEPLHDPDARVAMSLVGFDPDAEAYWLEAIHDTSLPDQEREDLIEDLNEEGLSDPRHPGPQDLPVILYRLRRIEDIATTADDFMIPHLREAYKDLANLAEVTQGGGEPVR
jgi:hypothetical protein